MLRSSKKVTFASFHKNVKFLNEPKIDQNLFSIHLQEQAAFTNLSSFVGPSSAPMIYSIWRKLTHVAGQIGVQSFPRMLPEHSSVFSYIFVYFWRIFVY